MATQAVMAAVDPLPLDDEKNQNEKFSQAAYYEDITAAPSGLKLDPRGDPLSPQPSEYVPGPLPMHCIDHVHVHSDPADPLNWPSWLKWLVLIQVAWNSLISVGSSAIINPAYVQLSGIYGITPAVASYPSCLNIIGAGLAPFIWIPLSNVFGARLIILSSTFCGMICAIGNAVVTDFWQLYITRTLQGACNGASMAIGAGIVSSLFFFHQRGRAMGIYTVFLTNGAHLFVIPGGYLAQYVGWRWTFWFTAILQGVVLMTMFFTVPETMYSRDLKRPVEPKERPIRSRLGLFNNRIPGRKLDFKSLLQCVSMFRFPPVLFAALYHVIETLAAIAFTFGSVLPSLTAAATLGRFYGYGPGQVGLTVGLATLLGAILGEIIGAQMLDRIARRARAKNGGVVVPEARIHGIWIGFVLLPGGLLLYSFCVQNQTHIIGPAMGMALLSLAVQCISAATYTYVSDCYRNQTSESAQVLNIARQLADFHIGFWALPLANAIGFDGAGGVYAAICFMSSLPILSMFWYGKGIRERMGDPGFNKDF